MSSYEGIYEVLNGGASKSWIGDRVEDLTVDQQIAAANVIALAAIAEELNSIKHHGIAQSGQHSPEPEQRKSAYEDHDLEVI